MLLSGTLLSGTLLSGTLLSGTLLSGKVLIASSHRNAARLLSFCWVVRGFRTWSSLISYQKSSKEHRVQEICFADDHADKCCGGELNPIGGGRWATYVA